MCVGSLHQRSVKFAFVLSLCTLLFFSSLSLSLVMNIINTTKHFTPKELVVLGGATILTVYNLIQFYRERKQLRGFNAPPHVAYSLPIFGHSLYLLYDNIRFTDWCIKTYGDIYDLDVFGKTMTVTSGVVAQQVFKVEEDQLSGIEGALKGKTSPRRQSSK